MLSLVLAGFAILRGNGSHSAPEERGGVKEGHRNENEAPRTEGKSKTGISAYIAFMLLVCLYTGSLMQILAQFFGILGLTINASLNAQDVVSAQGKPGLNNFVAHAWVVDKALSSYATVAWTSALLCAAIATVVFRTPRFAKAL
jgi:hypothetical protein